MARLFVDQELCTECQLCVDEYPEAFEMSEDGPAVVHDEKALDKEQIEDAIGLCPVEAIKFE